MYGRNTYKNLVFFGGFEDTKRTFRDQVIFKKS